MSKDLGLPDGDYDITKFINPGTSWVSCHEGRVFFRVRDGMIEIATPRSLGQQSTQEK